jgi:hypothetical protein
MKRLKVLTALAMGIMALASGVLQVEAATYNFFVDFSTKEVADYDDYRQTFNADTFNLDNQINFNWRGSYRMSSCSPTFTINASWEVAYRINGIGSYLSFVSVPLPDLPCVTTATTYSAIATTTMNSDIISSIINDDANFVEFRSRMFFSSNSTGATRVMTFSGYRNFFELEYDFNTTYLFNYFLSDQEFVSSTYSATAGGGVWTIGATPKTQLQYVYTTAGNDEFYILNTYNTSIGTTRKKYAVDYNEEFFRGESVGAMFERNHTGSDSFVISASGGAFVDNIYRYHYLNVSNVAQQIVDAPIFEFEEEDCGSFLALNVGCFINNAFAYITNDAPIVSDAFTLLNAGIEMAAQTFGIIGEFADDNVFGVLILAGFGFIAVKWFLKND